MQYTNYHFKRKKYVELFLVDCVFQSAFKFGYGKMLELKLFKVFSILFFIQVYACTAIRGVDFDIYPIRDSNSVEAESTSPVRDIVSKFAEKLSLGGGIYLGIQAARYFSKILRGKGIDSVEFFNATIADEMQKDQIELWTVVHKLYTAQSEKLSDMYNVSQNLHETLSRRLQSMNQSVEATLDSLSSRISAIEIIEQKLCEVDSEQKNFSRNLVEDACLKWQTEMNVLKQNLNSLHQEIPRIVQEHDAKTLQKFKEYAEELQKAVKPPSSPGSDRSLFRRKK